MKETISSDFMTSEIDSPQRKKQVTNKLFKFVLSSMAAMWVFTIYTMVDGMFVAKGVGPDALAAVNISMPMINVSFGLSILFAIGASTKASIYKGRNQYEKADEIFTLSTITVFLLSIVVATVCLLNLEKLAVFLGATSATKTYVMDYLRIILLFDVCYMTAYNLEVLVKADGFPEKAIYVPTLGAVVNIGLDYVFIFIFHWGIKGAAWATGISQLVTLIVFAHHFISDKSGFSFVKIRWSLMQTLSMAKLGISDFLTEFSMGVVIFIYNRTVLSVVGNSGVVIYTVISYISQLVLMTMVGLNQGMQPLTSYYYGKKDGKTRRYLFRTSMIVAVVLSVVAFLLNFVHPHPIVGLFINKGENSQLFYHGVKALRIFSFSFLPIGIVVVIAGYMTSLEKARSAMTISLCRGLIFVIISLTIMTKLFGETGIWMSMAISETCSMVLALILYNVNIKKIERKTI